jgi:selenocysteine-specific elongation factor
VSATAAPLTLGTSGHIDHGKTSLVRALTGVETDRLPAERARGMTIELGYAPLELPDGRRLSVVDVPGHERFVRTMIAGATEIDLYLMAIAADDGVMPQTREHAAVLRALGVVHGVVAITKCDGRDPTAAVSAARRLLPGAEVVTCSARTGQGVADVVAALARAAVRVRSRTSTTTPVVLHADRVFTMRGAGTVLTGTLWSGTIGRGDMLSLLPAGRGLRVCGVHVHGEAVAQAAAGERVAVNLAGVAVPSVSRGDALASPDAPVRVTRVWTSRSRWRRPPARPPGVSRSITPRAPCPGARSRWPAATGNSGSSNPCSSPTATGSSSVGSPRMTRSAEGSCSTHERGVTVPGPTCSSACAASSEARTRTPPRPRPGPNRWRCDALRRGR